VGKHDGRVAIVTGAASGIGRAISELLMQGGASVVAQDMDAEALTWTEDHRGVVAQVGDVTSVEDNAAMVDLAMKRFGRLDTLVLNAGVTMPGNIETLPMDSFDQVLNVNLRGCVLGLKAAVPALCSSGQGAVVMTASVSGLGGDPGMWAYNAAKGGVVNLVRAAAVELGHRGVRVNGVCPGPTRTGMTAVIENAAPEAFEALRRRVVLQRWAEPQEVAAVIDFLVSPAASFVTGVLIPVDGGISASTGQFTPPELA